MKVYDVITEQGEIFIRESDGKFYECLTNKECNYYYNYVEFKSENKYLRCGNAYSLDDGDVQVEYYDRFPIK